MIINMTGGGGGAGATLVVTGVTGSTCTVSKDTKTYTKTFGADSTATFKGLTTGTWTVTMTNSTQTAVRTIVITSDYTLTIAYFSATINITYPANSTCVVADSSGTTVTTNTNTTDSTKTFVATVSATGTYTITATSADGTKTKSTSISIAAEGQVESVTLGYVLRLIENGAYKVPLTKISDMTITTSKVEFGSGSQFRTKNKISIVGYSKLVAKVYQQAENMYGKNYSAFSLVYTNETNNSNNGYDNDDPTKPPEKAIAYAWTYPAGAGKTTTLQVSLQNVTPTSAYIGMGGTGFYGSYVQDMYLE